MAAVKDSKSKIYWWNYQLPLKFLWPVLAALVLALAFSVFNLLSLWQLRQEMRTDLNNLKITSGQPALTAMNTAASDVAADIAVSQPSIKISDLEVASGTEIAPVPVASTSGFFNFLSSSSSALLSSLSSLLVTKNSVSEPKEEKEAVVDEQIPDVSRGEQVSAGSLHIFGDNFFNLSNIDESQTDLFWDNKVTAFTFPPLYEAQKKKDCAAADCGLSRDEVDPSSLCLKAGCLRKQGTKLFFNDKALQLPPPLRSQDLSSVTIFSIGNAWLIGAVSGEAATEHGWVYRFDGLSYSPLLTDTTAYQINPDFGRGNGRIAFGGSADDFLVLYSGYDGKAFRFRGQKIEDLSKFFGLRVTEGGFRAQIFKTGSGPERIFYICSLTENKAKIIKLWSGDDAQTAGALDFSSLPQANIFRPESILCALSDEDNKKMSVAVRKDGVYSLWVLQDQGFDNSRARQVTSVNLNQAAGKIVERAVAANLELETKKDSAAASKLYLANNKDKFEETAPYVWHDFTSSGTELYWRIISYPASDHYYSPWFNHLSRLDYLLKE